MKTTAYLTLACLGCALTSSSAAEEGRLKVQPLLGQVLIDSEHPQYLLRHGGKHLFVCGPGDPEGFLYLGRRRVDGAREGPQERLIHKLIRHGGNCIYMQVVRSHGGDGVREENPFVDSDPAKGVDEDILGQWRRWFSLMDEHGILIYLFIYDDGSRPFGGRKESNEVPDAEKAFVETLVRHFKEYRNLIWIVGEESEEAYSHARVRAIARVIQGADDHGHLIATHHHSGTEFKAWEDGGPLNHFAMQLNAKADAVHRGAVEAVEKARGKYQVIYSENTAIGTDPGAMRRFAWAAAMGGTMPMVLNMDIETTPVELLRQCRYLQQFFESTDFYTMSPHDDLAHGSSAWVLADPGRSAIAYAIRPEDKMGIKGLPAGRYDLTWLDCIRGQRTEQRGVRHGGGSAAWQPPEQIGDEIAVWIRAAGSG